MKFSFSPLPSVTSKKVLAPIVPVTLRYKSKEFSTFALVDSGAAGAVISTVIAEDLGIEWNKLPLTQGFTASGTFRSHLVQNVEATVEGGKEKTSFLLNMSIIEGVSPYQCILGQRDLFQKAKIIFESYNKQFEIIFREFN